MPEEKLLNVVPEVIEIAEIKRNLKDLGLEITSIGIARMQSIHGGKKVNLPLLLTSQAFPNREE